MVQREANDESTRPSALRRLISRRAVEDVGRKVEFGDFVLLLYVATFVRQYLWLVDSRQTAWTLTGALTMIVWLAHLWTKEPVGERTPRRFWLGVVLPLFVVYGMRAALPDTSFVWRETGSPVFPFYNTLFRSHFWPNFNLYDERWGPRGLWETLAWPLRVTLKPERIGEIAIYSGRVSLAFGVAILCLFAARRDRRFRLLGFVTLAGAFLWAAMLTGYARYAVFVEVVGGVTLLCSAFSLLTAARGRSQRAVRTGVAALLLCALLAQCLFALSYVARHEWSGRPTVFDDYDAYKEEARYVLRDYELEKFLTPAERRPLTNVGAWVESGMLTSGVESLLAGDAPILCAYVSDYFVTAEGREKFAGALARSDDRRIASLCLQNELHSCRDSIKRRGL